MFKFTKISSTGIIGQMKIKGIFIIYISSFLVWIKDDSPSLEKTMKSLDNYLDQAGKILKFIN
jgi:ubiquinone biosynthesis protein COQ9